MSMRTVVLSLTVTLCLGTPGSSAPAAAQTVGEAVRFNLLMQRMPGSPTWMTEIQQEGIFAGRGNGRLLIVRGQDTLSYAMDSVHSLFVERPRTAGEGLLSGGKVGALIGGGVGALLGFLVAQDGSSSSFSETAETMAVGIIRFGTPALLVGVLAGALGPGSHWEELPVDAIAETPSAVAAPGAPATAESAAPRGPARWRLAIFTGPSGEGPTRDIKAALRAEGLTDGGYPRAYTGWGTVGYPWGLEASYHHSPRFGVSLVYANAELGQAVGRRSINDFLGDHLYINYGVSTVTALANLRTGPLHADIGPAYYRTGSWKRAWDRTIGGNDEYYQGHLGVAAGGGLSFLLTRSFSVELRYQYRPVGRATVGPFEEGQATFAATEVDFSHWFFGGGIGISF